LNAHVDIKIFYPSEHGFNPYSEGKEAEQKKTPTKKE